MLEKMTNCKACGKEIAKGVNKCPNCGKDQRNFFGQHKVITVILVLIVLGLIGGSMGGKTNNVGSNSTPASTSTSNTTSTSGTSSTTSKPEKVKYELLTSQATTESGIRYVTGQIRNNTDNNLSYIQVEINLYDASGNQVGSTLANANNLEAGKVWNFKAVIIEENAKTYKVMDITGM